MKFSEALLLGSMNSQQIFYMNRGGEPGRCALETAIEAAGYDVLTFPYWQRAMELWPWLMNKVGNKPIFEIIYDLNDVKHWPRPQIAEWARQYELMYDPEPVVKPIAEEVHSEV